ncbi:CidA/LrgA family protein [Romboutsia maritimum]|uniref:CidA/LrgA family protein n=1 Tax=Romboutsia maritimum TaxID=2020948 RepID=A0A371IVZ4_9FIRM|nr:CidA/LrgA family protein [Romboutsia maritimum]RDY24647.1 CidA/LrgA family protein [Romboutsia maritimum]
MKIFNQLAVIMGIWAVGEYISSFIKDIIVVPGSIVGMILLFLFLQFNVIKLEKIQDISDVLLDSMAIFFVPAGVALIKSLNLIEDNMLVLIATILFSTIIVMYVTGVVVEKMIKNKVKVKEN